jgi:hypothetical protein
MCFFNLIEDVVVVNDNDRWLVVDLAKHCIGNKKKEVSGRYE